MKDASSVDISDATDKLRSEPPEFFLVLDAALRCDAGGQRTRDQLCDLEVDSLRGRAVVMNGYDKARSDARFHVQFALVLGRPSTNLSHKLQPVMLT